MFCFDVFLCLCKAEHEFYGNKQYIQYILLYYY